MVLEQDLPDLVAAVRPWDLADHAPVHDDLLDRWTADKGAVSRLLHRHDLATPVETVGADEHLGLTVAEAGGDRLHAIAREQRDDDRADLCRREDRNRDLGTH